MHLPGLGCLYIRQGLPWFYLQEQWWLFQNTTLPISRIPCLCIPATELLKKHKLSSKKKKDKDWCEGRKKWQTKAGKKEWEENREAHTQVAFVREGKCILECTPSFDVHTLCKQFSLRDSHIVRCGNTFIFLFCKACNPSYVSRKISSPCLLPPFICS